jgi:hypothetical protein
MAGIPMTHLWDTHAGGLSALVFFAPWDPLL